MRIAIVDDLSTDAEALRKLLCRWASEQGIPLVPSPVILESGEALLAHFAPNAFDIIFLDIYMAGITGMEVARKIRELDTHCQLIFTTTTGEFAVDSYEVGAAYYLVKPFSYENLTQALSRCSAELLEQSQCVIIPGAAEQPPLLLQIDQNATHTVAEIRICQQQSRKISLPHGDEACFSAKQMNLYIATLVFGIGNLMEQVESLTASHFLLSDGTSVPVSRLKYKEVREKYLSFAYARMRGGFTNGTL